MMSKFLTPRGVLLTVFNGLFVAEVLVTVSEGIAVCPSGVKDSTYRVKSTYCEGGRIKLGMGQHASVGILASDTREIMFNKVHADPCLCVSPNLSL